MSSALGSPSRNSVKIDHKESKPSDIFIQKPHDLMEKCPIEIQKQQLPPVKQKKVQKKQKLKPKASSSETLQSWLKSKVSLPKLQTKVKHQRIDTDECFHSRRLSSSQLQKKNFSSFEKASSGFPFRTSSEFCKGSHKGDGEGLEFYSDAVGPSKCQFLFHVPSSQLEYENFKVAEEDCEPSHALRQWELWLKRRKHLQDFLSKKLERRPCDLLVNQSENFRKIIEDKTMFYYSQIPEPDKWRGHPYWWKPEPRLGAEKKDYIDCPKISPEYYPVRTNLNQGIVPSMEFIGVPIAIRKEEGLVCVDAPKSVNSTTKFWDESLYRKEQIKKYRKQRKKLKPNDIQMDELAVVGIKIKPKNEEDNVGSFAHPNIPKINVNSVEVGEVELNGIHFSRSFCSQRTSVLCLAVNDEEIKFELGLNHHKNLNKTTHDHTWLVEFDASATGLTIEKSLRIENRGTMAIRYEWIEKKIKPQQPLNHIHPVRREPWFLFNKNPGIFVPGQIYDLKFYHHTMNAGVRTESWYLKTTPQIFKNAEGGRIILTAVATNESVEKGIRTLGSYIEKRVSESIARDIFDSILYMATQASLNLTGIEYRSLFLEKELFEYHNPKHYYHSEVVQELKDLLLEMSSNKEMEWDFSLVSLLTLMNSCTTGETRDNLLRKISLCSMKLLRPNYVSEIGSKKYRMVYQVLCKMSNLIEEDYNYLRHCLSHKRSDLKDQSVSELYESEEHLSITNSTLEENEENKFNFRENFYDMNHIYLIHFQTMFNLKVYQRICEATENISGSIETCKLTKPWKEQNNKTFRYN